MLAQRCDSGHVGLLAKSSEYPWLINISDIKALTNNDPSLLQSVQPTLRKYNEEQLAIVNLPDGNKEVYVFIIPSMSTPRRSHSPRVGSRQLVQLLRQR